MMNYYERYQPDVMLAYNDLAKGSRGRSAAT
jgi:hypothetical protein